MASDRQVRACEPRLPPQRKESRSIDALSRRCGTSVKHPFGRRKEIARNIRQDAPLHPGNLRLSQELYACWTYTGQRELKRQINERERFFKTLLRGQAAPAQRFEYSVVPRHTLAPPVPDTTRQPHLLNSHARIDSLQGSSIRLGTTVPTSVRRHSWRNV